MLRRSVCAVSGEGCTCGARPHRLVCDLVLGDMTSDQEDASTRRKSRSWFGGDECRHGYMAGCVACAELS